MQDKTPRGTNFDLMDISELPYTVPRVVKGRSINKVPTGSTVEKEVAKQSWYVEFFFHNAAQERMERIRVTRKLNRIKDPRQKLRNFSNLCEVPHILCQKATKEIICLAFFLVSRMVQCADIINVGIGPVQQSDST